MKLRTIYLTCKIADSDFIEAAFFETVERELGNAVVDSRTLTNTDKMYKEDSFFRSLSNSLKKSKKVYENYINENNSKWT